MRRFLSYAALLFAASPLAPTALGQDSPNPSPTSATTDDVKRLQDELAAQRKETESLRKELADTRTQLADLKRTLADVKGLLERLLAAPSKPSTPVSPTAKPAELPSDPFACPDCLLQELRKRYAAAFTSPTPAEGPARRERLADIVRWCRNINHDLRGKTRWIVRIETLKDDAGKLSVTYTILDPNTRAALGSPRTDTTPAQFSSRLKAGGPGAVYEIGLWTAADVKFDENRPDEGIFNVPMLVAPYVVWDMKAEWTSLEPIEGDRSKKNPADPAR